MQNLARIAALLLLATLPTFAHAVTGTAAASESTITVSSAGIPGETYKLAQMYGDWFATATDAHATLTMRTLPGPHQAQLTMEWDGKRLTQTIDAAKSNDIHSKFQFSLHLTGPGAYGQSVQLNGADTITVAIARMDNLTLEGTFSGTGTGAGPVKISGVIKLHRATTAEQPTGTFGNCDPAIHDLLAGAEWRSPSDCEVKFDAYVRKGLTAALQPVIDGLTARGWGVTRQVEAQSLTSIPRHSEGKPFRLAEQTMHQGAPFFVNLGLNIDSPIFQQYDGRLQAAMQQFVAALKSMNAADGAAAQTALSEAGKAEEEHTKIAITVWINSSSIGIASFKGGHTVTTLPTGGFAVSAPYVQAPTGGDVTAAQAVTYVFIGPFTPPASSGSGTGDEAIHVNGGPLSVAPAKLLTMQSVVIRIQTGPELAQQVIKLIDWSALQKLMARK